MKTKKPTTQIKTLLWATDFSKESRACLPYIRCISEKLNTENHAVYVLPKFSDWVYEAAFVRDEELLETIEKTKVSSLQKIETAGKNVQLSFKSNVLEGIASEGLIQYAEQNNVDIIFAGRRGVSEIEAILIGSTTSRLIRNSRIPIFVIPKNKRAVKIDRILCPIDLSEATLLEMSYSINLAKQLNAKLHVVHVAEFFNYKVPVFKRDMLLDRINQRIREIAEESQFEIENVIFEIGEPAHRIIKVAKSKKIDLIIMSTHQRKGFEKLFLGSISEKVLMYSDIPVLILPPSDNELS